MVTRTTFIQGLTSNQWYGCTKSLSCLVPAIELPNYFSVFNVPLELDAIFSELSNKTNEARIQNLCDEIKLALNSKSLLPNLSLTVAVSGKARIDGVNRSNLTKLFYSTDKACVVSGIITLLAILRSLGFEPTYTKRKATKSLILSDSKLRQELSAFMVPVTILFNDEIGLLEKDIIVLCKSYNLRSEQLHTTLWERFVNESPLVNTVHQLAQDLNIDSLGGMSVGSNRITKNDSYITTESTMIRLLLGAVGGPSIQASTQIARKLSDGTPIDGKLLGNLYPYVYTFLSAWLKETKYQFLKNPNGFHFSTQIWQALGLVVHHIVREDSNSDLTTFEAAGKILGELDYSRNAKHWSFCNTMMLDATGKNYKNATQGGRTFREGIAKYFVGLIQGDRG